MAVTYIPPSKNVGESVHDINNNFEYLDSKAITAETNIENLQESKIDKESGKSLSANDFTDELKEKLEGMAVDSDFSNPDSGNPVAGKTILAALNSKANNTDIQVIQSKLNGIEEGYLPLSGGTLNKDAAITIPSSTDGRYTKYSYSGLTCTMPDNDGGWANGVTFKNKNGSAAGQICAYGKEDALEYYYMGESYTNPLIKVSANGQTTIKSSTTPLVVQRSTVNSSTIDFKNAKGSLGAIGITYADGPLRRWTSDNTATYDIIDTGNYMELLGDNFVIQNQSLLYSSSESSSSPLTISIEDLFTKYSVVICNVTTSSGTNTHILPLKYIKSLGSSDIYSYYGAEGLLYYYDSDSSLTIRTGLGQVNPTINSVRIISLY